MLSKCWPSVPVLEYCELPLRLRIRSKRGDLANLWSCECLTLTHPQPLSMQSHVRTAFCYWAETLEPHAALKLDDENIEAEYSMK